MIEKKVYSSFKDWWSIQSIVITCALCLCVIGCTDMKVRAGTPVNISDLNQLIIGESHEADIKAVLGAPFGSGRSYLPFQEEYTDLWSYYYELGTMEDDRRTFLFIFLNDGMYVGYMWFSSLPDVQP